MAKTTDSFLWPPRPLLDAPERAQFATALNEQMRVAKLATPDLARKLYGMDAERGKPMHLDKVSCWVSGEKFPEPDAAVKIAKVLHVPLSRLLAPKGPLMVLAPKKSNATKKNTGQEPTRGQPVRVALPLPSGAKAPTYDMKTNKHDPRFMDFAIMGTADVDTVLALIALVAPSAPR